MRRSFIVCRMRRCMGGEEHLQDSKASKQSNEILLAKRMSTTPAYPNDTSHTDSPPAKSHPKTHRNTHREEGEGSCD